VSETSDQQDDLRFEQTGSLALITLQRTRALNALTIAMRASLATLFPKLSRDPTVYAAVIRSASAKAFSAGSDVREVAHLGRTDMEAARQTFRDEYALNWRLECFSKPTVSLMDGMVMGGGVGVSLYGTHRVAGEGYRFAMPETKIGLFPDVGVCHALSRMPGQIGQYLGLTGRTIGRADAYALGLVTHCIPAARFGEIVEGLTDTYPVDPLLDDRHADPGPGEIEKVRETIARCFSAPDVPEIIARLESEKSPNADWAKATAAELKMRAPLSLAVTCRHIELCANLDLRQVLEMDYRLACRFLEDHDFYEGVRAVVIDKDNAPAWNPSRIADVTRDRIERYFAVDANLNWKLPTRAEMQAMRA
jgi:enoyl-CoA hydratase/carnithine racemase